MFEALIGLVWFVLVIWALVTTLKSKASSATKLLWSIVLILLPVIGLVLWFFIGPRDRAAIV